MYLGGITSVLGRYDDSERYFQEADQLNIRGTMQYAEAQTNLWWGRMLLARDGAGDAERASHLLECARAAGRERGYCLVEGQAAALQRR